MGEVKHFEMFFKSSPTAKKAVVHLAIPEEENLEVRRVFQPIVMLRMKNDTEISDTEILNTEKDRHVPKITFTKINFTKYRVKVERAKELYTLVFSENYHPGWKVYTRDIRDTGILNTEKEEMGNGKEKGGDNIIASYFDGEIKEGRHRNTFLEKATFETWSKKPIDEGNHFLVNSYANSWYIDPARICMDKGSCRKNADGSYDMDLIVEFWPQRLFYVGLFISGLTLVGCLGYLIYLKIRDIKRY